MKCIYFKGSEPIFKFTKREHVIPAGLGGGEKLPLGYVSDEANELFSSTELVALRKTFLAINRENVGPGKRGSMNAKKIKDPNIRVLKDVDFNGDNFKLGFAFAGETYVIPQIYLNFNDIESTCMPMYFATELDGQNGRKIIYNFRLDLTQFLLNKNRTFKLIEMPFKTDKHFIAIGSYNNKWFAATSHKYINMDYLSYFFLKDIVDENLEDKDDKTCGKILQNYQYQLDLNTHEFYFIYVKTAFNALALFMGVEFVSDDIFNSIREAILNVINCSNFVVHDFNVNESIINIISKSPEKSHYVIIESKENYIFAYVGFYGEKEPAIIRLTSEYKGNAFTKTLICDWQNKKEYLLS